jgi:hypothetical protein
MLEDMNSRHDLSLQPESLKLKCGARVELDGYDPDKRVLCEVYAHIGPLKGSQPDKMASDILKMILVGNELGDHWRKIYCFADKAAAQKLSGDSWLACAAKQFGVEPVLVDLKDARDLVMNAQRRQTMVNK